MSDQASDAPKGVRLTLLDPAFMNNPYSVLKKVRDAAPVLHDDLFSRWFLTGFDLVRQVLRDKDVSVDVRKTKGDSYAARMMLANSPDKSNSILASIMFLDDPEHRRLRGLVSRPFTPKMVEVLRPRVRAIAEEILKELQGEEFDLVTSFTAPLTSRVTAEMLGVDPADYAQFKTWSDVIVANFYNPFRAKKKIGLADAAQVRLDAYFRARIELRRREPADDMISALLAAEQDGDRLTEKEILTECSLLILAGQITTTDAIGNGVRALLEHPTELVKLRLRPELIERAVEEMLRYDVPTISTYRIIQKETPVGGCPFHAGDIVTLSLAGANRDPTANIDPDRFDIERADVRHMAFGGGKHMCLGAPLARIELQEGVLALLRRFPNLRASERGCRFRPIVGLRGMSEFWLQA